MKQVQASYSFKMMICFILLILAGTASSSEQKCPFTYVYHFGDGATDIGNTIHILSLDPNPSKYWPYGITYPGWPTSRWCDGKVDFDYTAVDFGVPIVPYLEPDAAINSDGVIFSVARSPVLPHAFFASQGINIPSFAVPLETQLTWFRTYLKRVCNSTEGCAERLANALVLLGDIEGNDIGYALTQGKSIAQVRTYVPLIIQTMINASREFIRLGATRLIIPGNGPLGCAPYILTALLTNDSTAYDELGCLKSVNEFVVYKNSILNQSLTNLSTEFPDVFISYGNMYDGIRQIINETSIIGDDGINNALKSCCGVGGNYNYDSERFCGSPGVPLCPNPNEYIYWDGLHFTQEAYRRMETLLVQDALVNLNCTTSIQSIQDSSLSASF